jgi:hypothetical protein
MATQLKEPEIAEEAAEAVDPLQTQERDYEAEARVRGWRPEEEFTGKSEWVDAETFIKRGEENLGLAKATIDQLRKRVSVLEGMNKKLTKLEQAAYSNAMDAIRAEMREAVTTGDQAAFDALDQKAEQLRKDMAEETPQSHGEDPNAEYLTFREANPWYDKAGLASATETEIEARLFADRLSDRLAAEGLTKSLAPSAFFDRVAKETKEKFPLLGAKPVREKPNEAVAGVTRGQRGSAKTGANLPADAKAAAERYMNNNVGAFGQCKTKEEAHNLFARDFDWGETK